MSDPEAPGSQQAIARTFLENGFNLTQLAGLQDVDETKRYFKDRTRLKPTLKFAITVIRAIGPDFYFDPLWLVLAYTLRTKAALKQIPDAPIVKLALSVVLAFELAASSFAGHNPDGLQFNEYADHLRKTFSDFAMRIPEQTKNQIADLYISKGCADELAKLLAKTI